MDEIVKIKDVKFSPQSMSMLKRIPGIDFENIAKWYINNKLVIGGSHILEYLEYKDKGGD